MKAIDEEEKYFDSESPVEEITPIDDDIEKLIPDEEEDELDTYMKMLKKNEITDCVADKLKNL